MLFVWFLHMSTLFLYVYTGLCLPLGFLTIHSFDNLQLYLLVTIVTNPLYMQFLKCITSNLKMTFERLKHVVEKRCFLYSNNNKISAIQIIKNENNRSLLRIKENTSATKPISN